MMIEQLVVGDTLDFYDTAPEHPASDGWTLVYRLVPEFATPVQAPITLTASTYDTTAYRVQVGSPTTATWAPGKYTWSRWVEQTGQRVSLGAGRVQLLADPATIAQGHDSRGHAQIMLDQVEAALAALNLQAKSYTIGDTSYTRADLPELLTMRARYLREVASEAAAKRLAAGLGGGRKIQVRF